MQICDLQSAECGADIGWNRSSSSSLKKPMFHLGLEKATPFTMFKKQCHREFCDCFNDPVLETELLKYERAAYC